MRCKFLSLPLLLFTLSVQAQDAPILQPGAPGCTIGASWAWAERVMNSRARPGSVQRMINPRRKSFP